MSYSTITKEIKFILNGETGRKVEGFWACRHGTGRDISRVFVSMIATTGSKSTLIVNYTDKKTETISTPTQTSRAWSSKLMEFKNYSGTIISKFYRLFIGAALLVLIMFVVCSIWISHRFRDIQLKINSRVQNHLSETEAHAMDLNDDTDERIDRISDYDSINENEMLPFPSVVAFSDKDSSLDTDNIATNHACNHENTSSSDISYLEVIDDSTYLNPYQSIDVQQDSIIVHDYCTTSDINFLDMCSPKLIEKSSNEQYSTCDTDVSTNHDKLDVTAQYLPNKYAAAQFKERRDHEVLQTYSSQFESTEINLRFSENIDSEILFEKTPFAGKSDYDVSDDTCIFSSNATSTLL